MFGAFRYEPGGKDVGSQPGGFVPLHSACTNCRSRKLKCGGQKGGCDRCKSSSSNCVYPSAENGPQKRRKKVAAVQQKHKNPEPVGSSAQPAPTRVANQPSADDLLHLDEPSPRTSAAAASEMQVDSQTSRSNSTASDFAGLEAGNREDSPISNQVLFDLMPELDPQEPNGYSQFFEFGDNAALEKGGFQLPDLEQSSCPEKPHKLHSNGTATFSVDQFPTPTASSPAPSSDNPFQSSSRLTNQQQQQQQLQQQHLSWDTIGSSNFIRTPQSITRCNTATISELNTSPDLDVLPIEWKKQCQCLQEAVRLLEELGNRARTTSLSSIDSNLACHRDALSHGNAMARCEMCITRSDNMMLLSMVLEKLTDSCQRLVDVYLEHAQQEPDGGRAASQSERPTTMLDRSGPKLSVQLGCYRTDAWAELRHVWHMFMALHLKKLFSLLCLMQGVAEETSRGLQLSALEATGKRVKAVAERLKNPMG